jgi:hypothetical protein
MWAAKNSLLGSYLSLSAPENLAIAARHHPGLTTEDIMATKNRKKQKPAEELRDLKNFLKRERKDLDKAEKKLLLCLRDCLNSLHNNPPWHYGPRCPRH